MTSEAPGIALSVSARRRTGDADNDSIPNMVELALLSDPHRSGPFDLTFPTVVAIEGKSYGVFSFRQRLNGVGTVGVDYTADGVTCKVEVSNDLNTWTSGNDLVEPFGLPIDNGDGTLTVRVKSKEPLLSPGSSWFARLNLAFNDAK